MIKYRKDKYAEKILDNILEESFTQEYTHIRCDLGFYTEELRQNNIMSPGSAMDYEKYKKECKRIRKENKKLISGFETWLSAKGLSEKTIDKHASNVHFYVNEYLLYEDAIEAKDGAGKINMFLGYWFIRKAMWANKTAIKENAASLKKFYQYLHEDEKVSKEAFSALKESIKEDMPEWLATMDRYDDPDIEDMEEVWGI